MHAHDLLRWAMFKTPGSLCFSPVPKPGSSSESLSHQQCAHRCFLVCVTCDCTIGRGYNRGRAHRVDGLGERPDLVDLQQQRVAPLAVDALLHALRVRHQQIVAHHLRTGLWHRVQVSGLSELANADNGAKNMGRRPSPARGALAEVPGLRFRGSS